MMFLVIASLHVVTGPVLLIMKSPRIQIYSLNKYFLRASTFGDAHTARTARNPDVQFAPLMVALQIGFSKFLKENIFFQSQRDPNIFHILAT